jgi:hypothetical protein
VADEKTLEAIIANRYEVMAGYAREMRLACKAEIAAFQGKQGDLALLKTAKRWLPRDEDKVPESALPGAGQGPCSPPGARQDGRHARRTAPALAQHAAIRASNWRPICRPGAGVPKKAALWPCSSSR